MSRKLLFLSIGLLLALAVVLVAATGDKYSASVIPDRQEVQITTLRAPCSMNYSSLTGAGFWSGYEAGDQTVSYFDPTNAATSGCGDPSPYPFEITAFTFTLYDDGNDTWPANVDIVVYDVDPTGDPCAGPAVELCRFSVIADQTTFGFPSAGTAVFPAPCCVSGPFFIGLEYTSGTAEFTPSIVYDDNTNNAPTCVHFFYRNSISSWLEWYSQWGGTIPGNPMFFVDGETVSGNCAQFDIKMLNPQYPDEAGWDVMATEPMVLADDWQCIETGYVKDIHFWGSWIGGVEGLIDHFVLSIHEDIPADPADPLSYSRPGVTLREYIVTQFEITPIFPSTQDIYQGWYDPSVEFTIYPDHQQYFRYDVYLDEPDWFPQDEGTIYWLNISAVLNPDGPPGALWGWKSTLNHWNDDAVWAFWGDLLWIDIWEPAKEEICNFFEAHLDPTGLLIPPSYGNGAWTDPITEEQWFEYEEWVNIWFYDHPFSDERIKDIVIIFTVQPDNQAIPEFFLEITANWTTPEWSFLGYDRPPLPDDFPPDGTIPEDRYIGRGDPLTFTVPGEYEYRIRIPDYNPEWVSVDIRGFNAWVEGEICHYCRGSLDLAFLITGDPGEPPTGACCYPEPTGGPNTLCVVTTPADCASLGGVYEGDGTTCQGTEACCLQSGACVMADALCCVNELSGTPQGAGSVCGALEACCMPDGSCEMLDPLCCIDQLGTPQGVGEVCTVVGVCCMPNGTCRMLDPLCCEDLLGTPSPWGATSCMGDVDNNGIDDACEPPPQGMKWRQRPDLLPTGMDVDATTIVMADDFLCTEEGPITEIHVWGSWLNDIVPGDPGNVNFYLSIHTDIPAGHLMPWSVPGELIWSAHFGPGEFEVIPYATDIYEGWYNPAQAFYLPEGDHVCYEYIFRFNATNWFIQDGSETQPIVFWLDVHAMPPTEAYFGWKTTVLHDRWNDDCVWGPDEGIPSELWTEVTYPEGHPDHPASVDLAFMLIGGQPCDCVPAECDGAPNINILDIVYLINYIYKSGPAPVPYALCSGDPNCDCTINILDIVYIINYIYKNGPAPCSCEDWVTACGLPLRK